MRYGQRFTIVQRRVPNLHCPNLLDTWAAVVALATDPRRARWNQRSVTSGQLAAEYGFTDVDGSRPDIWHYMEVRERGLEADPKDYR